MRRASRSEEPSLGTGPADTAAMTPAAAAAAAAPTFVMESHPALPLALCLRLHSPAEVVGGKYSSTWVHPAWLIVPACAVPAPHPPHQHETDPLPLLRSG